VIAGARTSVGDAPSPYVLLESKAMTVDERGVLTSCPSCGRTNRLGYATLDRQTRCGHCHTMLAAPSHPIEVSGAVFDALISASSVPVVIDFWAPWCGPCRAMAPELDKVAHRMTGRVLVVKVNTEAEPALGERFGIRSIPTLAVFRGGREVTRAAGARPAADIERLVSAAATA
jgi:thioredoxin 2